MSEEVTRDDIDEDYNEPSAEVSEKERRLVTQSYDLSVNTLLEQWDDKTLLLPEIQRQYVWDSTRASRLIESLLLNIPIPVVYFSETEQVRYLVIDGHQRIQSIARFVTNQFPLRNLRVLTSLNGKRFAQLPEREQRVIRTRVIRAIIISADSDPTMKFEVFERLNTGSIALNAQEVRNSTHRGPMNELIKELVLLPEFRICVGYKKPRGRMVDNELILRHLALMDGWETYRPPLGRFMNNYLERGNSLGSDKLEEVRAKFEQANDSLADVFLGESFRITDREGRPTERSINRALADVQLTSFSWIADPSKVASLRPAILAELSDLYDDQSFLDSIQRATGDRRRTLRRLAMFGDALSRAGVKLTVRVPHPEEI